MRRTYTEKECAKAAENLAAAEAAERALALGQAVARIRDADKDLEFRDSKLLAAYKAKQQGIVDTCTGCRRTPTRSFRFVPN